MYQNQKNEDISKLLVEVSKLLGVENNQKDVAFAHQFLEKKARNESKMPASTAIMARFVRRSVRHKIYNDRKFAKTISQSNFPVEGMQKLYVYENLTRARKYLLWRTKPIVK